MTIFRHFVITPLAKNRRMINESQTLIPYSQDLQCKQTKYSRGRTRRRTVTIHHDQCVHVFKFMCNASVTGVLQVCRRRVNWHGRFMTNSWGEGGGENFHSRSTDLVTNCPLYSPNKFHFRDTGGVRVLHKTTLIKLIIITIIILH